MRGALAVVGLLVLVASCHRSRYAEGRDETVRQRLPKKFPFEALEQADRLQLIAVDEPGAFPEHLAASTQNTIRATADVTSAADRERVIRTLYRAIRDAAGYFVCFEPHHAIRAWRKGVAIEIVICFSCAHMYVPNGEGGDQMVVFMPTAELMQLWEKAFEPVGLHFDEKKAHFGGWVHKK